MNINIFFGYYYDYLLLITCKIERERQRSIVSGSSYLMNGKMMCEEKCIRHLSKKMSVCYVSLNKDIFFCSTLATIIFFLLPFFWYHRQAWRTFPLLLLLLCIYRVDWPYMWPHSLKYDTLYETKRESWWILITKRNLFAWNLFD